MSNQEEYPEWFSNSTIMSNKYKKDSPVDYWAKAKWLIEGGFPVPTSNIEDLAKILRKKDDQAP